MGSERAEGGVRFQQTWFPFQRKLVPPSKPHYLKNIINDVNSWVSPDILDLSEK